MSAEYFEVKLHKRIYQATKMFLSSSITTKKNIICQFLPNQVLRVSRQNSKSQENKSEQLSLQKIKKFINKMIKKTNIVKIEISEKAVSRVLNMKQWKSKVKGQNVVIISEQKMFGRCYFLAGLTSLKNLIKISNQFQSKGYKKFLTKYNNSAQNKIILGNLLENVQFRTLFYDSHSISDFSLFQNTDESTQCRLRIKCQTQYYISTQTLTQIFHDLIERLFCSFTISLKLSSARIINTKQFQVFQNMSQQFKQRNIQSFFYPHRNDQNLFRIGIIGSQSQCLIQKQCIFQKINSFILQDFQILRITFTKGFKLNGQIKNSIKQMNKQVRSLCQNKKQGKINSLLVFESEKSKLESEKSQLKSEKNQLESEKNYLKSGKNQLKSEKNQLKSEKSQSKKGK